MRSRLAVVLLVAACGVRAPHPIDIGTLVATRGPVDARRDLIIRVLAHPRDVQARLALAALADSLGRPSEAIEQLDAVEKLGGPIGVRWHDDDRARLGRLVLARGRVRLARGAPTALADFERAATLGARATDSELASARTAQAIALLRHIDPALRAKGRAILAQNAQAATVAAPSATATPEQHGAFGAWAWSVGARREAYEQLVLWHEATKPPRDEALQGAYLRAVAWWVPIWLGEAPPPPAEDLVGPERCLFPGSSCPATVVEEAPLPPLAATDPAMSPYAVAAARYAETHAILGPTGQGIAPSTSSGSVGIAEVAGAYRRDPAVAERLGRDYVATSVDAALAQASLGALFDALGDPGRARIAWQAAVDGSAEPSFLRGLAEAMARGGDAPAALVMGTASAAASGDPAIVWVAVSAALVDSANYVEALTASRSALDLAGPEVLPQALDVAIAASRGLGRTAQADAMLLQRAQLAPRTRTDDSEVKAALDAHRSAPTASTAARLWVVSRAHPREVELRGALLAALERDDARRPVVVRELVDLAGDPDPYRAAAAVAALR